MDSRYRHLTSEERGVILAENQRGASLREIGGLAHLRDISLLGLSTGYGRLLTWLGTADPLAMLEPPADRVTPTTVFFVMWHILFSVRTAARQQRLDMPQFAVRP